MDVTLIAAIASAGGVAIMAMTTAIILSGRAAKPWSLLADERFKRAKAEADRDAARQNEQHLATMVAERDRTIDAQKLEIGKLTEDARPAPGHGTDGLRRQAEAERAGAADRGDGDDPSTPVPRVTSPGPGPGGPLLPR